VKERFFNSLLSAFQIVSNGHLGAAETVEGVWRVQRSPTNKHGRAVAAGFRKCSHPKTSEFQNGRVLRVREKAGQFVG